VDSLSPGSAAAVAAGQQFSSAAAAAEAILQQRPSYSINGILGIPQPADANANSINKRKRDENGEWGGFCMGNQYDLRAIEGGMNE
jgi:hypothetical protein